LPPIFTLASRRRGKSVHLCAGAARIKRFLACTGARM
jgi:hypothetical protein